MAEWTLRVAVGIEMRRNRRRWRAEAGGTHHGFLPSLSHPFPSLLFRTRPYAVTPHTTIRIVIIDRTFAFAFPFTTFVLFSCFGLGSMRVQECVRWS